MTSIWKEPKKTTDDLMIHGHNTPKFDVVMMMHHKSGKFVATAQASVCCTAGLFMIHAGSVKRHGVSGNGVYR